MIPALIRINEKLLQSNVFQSNKNNWNLIQILLISFSFQQAKLLFSANFQLSSHFQFLTLLVASPILELLYPCLRNISHMSDSCWLAIGFQFARGIFPASIDCKQHLRAKYLDGILREARQHVFSDVFLCWSAWKINMWPTYKIRSEKYLANRKARNGTE